MKKTGWLLVAALLLAAYGGTAAQTILFSESFDSYATNETALDLEFSGDRNARVIADQPGGKAFLLPCGQEEGRLGAKITGAGEEVVVTARIKWEGARADAKIGMKDAGGRYLAAGLSQNGEITAPNGRIIGTVGTGAYVRLDIGFNTVTNRYFMAVDQKIEISNVPAAVKLGTPSGLVIETGLADAAAAVVDDLAAYGGHTLLDALPKAAYNPEELEYTPYIYEEADAVKIIVQNNFDGNSGTGGLMVNAKDNLMDVRSDDSGGKYLYAKKSTENDCFFDISVNGISNKLILKADIRVDNPGYELYLFRLRRDSTNWSGIFMVNQRGELTLYNGVKLCSLKKGQFVNVAALCDFKKKTHDIYLNGQLFARDVPFENAGIGKPDSIRTQLMPGAEMGDFFLDNLEVYDAAELTDLSTVQVDGSYTVLPDSKPDEEKLKGSVALHLYSDNLFDGSKKVKLDARPFVENGRTLVPVRAIAEAFSIDTGWEEATGTVRLGELAELTVESPEMTVGGRKIPLEAAAQQRDGRVFLPLRALAEEVLGKKVFYDESGLIVISSRDFKYAGDPGVVHQLGNYLFFDRPSAAQLKERFEKGGYQNVHPRVMANREDFERIKKEYQTNSYIRQWTDSAIARADAYLERPPTEYSIPDGLRLLDASRETKRRLSCLGFAYQITGGEKYAQRAWKEMEKVCGYPDWNPKHFLDVGEMTAGVGIGYDWCYDYLTPEQRGVIEDGLVRCGLDAGRNQYMGNFIRTNFVFQDMNWNAVCNGGLTVGAMAIADARPEDAFYTMQNALRSLEYMMPEFLPDGGWVEGPGYWEYMMEYMAYMVEAMKYPLGTDFNIMNYKGMSQTAYYMYSMYGNAGTNNYHDAGVSKTLPVQLFWLGKTLKDPGVTAARLLTMQQLNQTGDHWDCLWYDTAVTGEKVDLPLDVYSRNVETGAMRSSWEDKQGMYISYNGGRNNVNHYHLDAGAFVLDMFGERWAADLGSESLTYSVSFSGGRDNVYRVRPEGHNTLVINPSSDAGQSRAADCKVRRVESKPRGALQVLELTPAYESQVNSAQRGFLLTGDRRTFVVRDELSLKQESEVYWFMHTPADIEITGSRSAMLSIGGKRMKFDFDTDAEEAELSVMAAEPLPTSPKIAGQSSNAGYQKLAIRVKAKEKVQISARLTPADEASAQTAFRCDNIADWSIPEGELQTLPQCDALYADGKAIEGFSPEQGSYVVKLPHDCQRMPEITAESQSGTVQYLRKAATPEDSCEIRVTAQNGSYRSYFVAFRVLPEFGAVGGYQRYSPQDITASENPEPENRDVNAVDADLNTRWSADGEQWLRCDLGEAKSVDAFAVAFMRGDGRKYSFRVEVSEDGKSYTPVFEGLSSGTTTDYEIYEIPRVQARFIRYYGMGNNENTWNSVTEFAVLTKGAES